jgi:endonuclease/exonuclease/phosphatase family metal-dependent hydrolase
MTFNIRYDNPADSINSWDNRKSLVVETLKTESPDIIGMQEVLLSQLTYLDGHLNDYGHVGVGRVDGKTSGEYVPVFYRSDHFNVVDWGTFWLSDTPEDTGSVGWDAALPRICTWVKFTDLETNKDFFFLNTHFDHMGQTARKESARLILDFIARNTASLPVIVTGDFNCSPEQEPYHILTSPDNGLKDACLLANGPEGCIEATFNGFGTSTENERIDLVLVKGYWKVESSQMLKIRDKEMYISDHYPVICNLAN